MRQRALDVEIPDLHVAEAIVGIDRKIVGDEPRRNRGKTVGERERRARARDVGRSLGERRLKREILNDVGVLREIVVDAVAGADDGVFQRAPGDADARSEVVAIGMQQRCGKSRLAGQHDGRSGETIGDVEVGDAIVRFGVRAVVFVAETEIQRKLGQNAPVVLREKIEGVRREIVRVGARLQSGLLRRTDQEIGEVVAGVGDRRRAAGSERGSFKSGEDERALGILRGAETLQNAAIVAAEAKVVFAAIPGERVGNCVGLIEFAARRGIGEAAERVEADAGDAEVERIGGDAGDSGEAGDVGVVGVEIRCRNVIVIVGEAKNVGAAAVAVGPAGVGLQTLRVGVAGERRKWIHESGIVARIVEAEVDVVLRAATAAAATATATSAASTPPKRPAGIAEIVDEAQADRVGVAVVVGDVVKVLRRGVEIGQRDVGEQSFRLRAD